METIQLIKSNETNQLIVSFNIIKQMFADRGVDATALMSVTNEELIDMSADSNHFTVNVNDKMQLMYIFGKHKASDILNIVKESDMDYMLIVSKDKLNITFYKNVMNGNESKTKIQLFFIRELMFNPYRHELVPKHEILSKEEADHVTKLLNLKSKAQLPLIFQDDPIARYLFVRSGQVVRIVRNSSTSGLYYYYRYCV